MSFIEKRPTCVAVIGWFWIIAGVVLCYSAATSFFTFILAEQILQAESKTQANISLPFIAFSSFPPIILVPLLIGILGIISGANFIRLKEWSRSALTFLTWLCLIFIVAFGVVTFAPRFLGTTSSEGSDGLSVLFTIMSIVSFGFYAVPLAIIAGYLRGSRVKNAMTSDTEPTDG